METKHYRGTDYRTDGIVRAVKLQAGKNYLERALQQLYPPELSCDRPQEPPRAPVLKTGVPVYKPRRGAAVATGLRIKEIAEHEQNQ